MLPPMSEAEYLAFADTQEIKYEYSQGLIYAMTGAAVRHNTISASIIIHIGNLLSDKDCTVTTSDTRVHVLGKKAYRYPDVTVFCGDAAYLEGRTDTITNPVLLVEVLSPGTALGDRNDKLAEYTQIKSLQAYVLVAQDMPRVEIYRRYEGDRWLYEYATGLEAEIEVPIAATVMRLPLTQIYRRVRWDEETAESSQA